MKKLTVKKYDQNDYKIWNDFVSQAKNATFLFHRNFMEYHKDRFEDFSLLIFENEKLRAILPANKKANSVYSHQGLTYGGFVFTSKLNAQKVDKNYLICFLNTFKLYFDDSLFRTYLKMIQFFSNQSFSSHNIKTEF